MRRRLSIALALCAALAAALAGCGSPRKTMLGNLPPETTLFVQGPVDTVNHVVHLYWFGSDVDGSIAGFELRLRNPAAPADTQWAFTVRTDSVFTVFTPQGYVAPVFEVRAIDDAGLRDPTPAREDFQFGNQPPTVSFTGRFRTVDTTFASASPTWAAQDVDGDPAKMRFRVWLDGHEADANLVSGRSFTFPTSQFLQGGQLQSGYRTMYLQAIDDGGMASPVDSARWYVRAPAGGGHRGFGRLLIIDDVPASNPAGRSTDSLYTNAAARNLPAGTWSVLKLDTTQPFRTTEDLRQTFELFDAVVWYIGGGTTFTFYQPLLHDHEAGIAAYLDWGGSLYLDGLDLIDGVNARGPLSQDFLRDRLGSDGLIQRFDLTAQDSTSAWGIRASPAVSFYVPSTGDSLGMIQAPSSGLRAFVLRDPGHELVRAPAGTLSQVNPADYTVAVSVPQSAGGRVILLTFPLRLANRTNTAPRLLGKAFEQLGLTGP